MSTDVSTLRSLYARRWLLDPQVTFLNHGSFGACPRDVLEVQAELRQRMERQPVQFLLRELELRLDEARVELARFLGADSRDLVFVPNATTGVNAVLHSLRLDPGDELLTTDHDYNACQNAMNCVARKWGARLITARVPFPITSGDQIVQAIVGHVTSRTRLALVSHVTSPTGLIWPIERIVRELAAVGVDTLVDGAHAPGMVDLNLEALNAAYYTGNCHKWLCAPKGAGFLHVRADRQEMIHPSVISHAANTRRVNRSRLLMEFDWTGTSDPTPYLALPAAIQFVTTLMPGGLPALCQHNRQLVLEGRRRLCEQLRVTEPCPDSMIGSLAAVALPDERHDPELIEPRAPTICPVPKLQERLWNEFRIEVPVIPWPAPPRQWIRISAQAYNTADDYDRLCTALAKITAS
jgi:isopenicillin-N epimerase